MFHAYVFRNGEIGFGCFVPEKAMRITSSSTKKLRPICEAIARHAYDGFTLLVPGVPEADDDEDAIAAVIRFRHEVDKRLGGN